MNCESTQSHFWIPLCYNLFFFISQGEDLRDLDDTESNQSLRKELAPLLEPLEMKDVWPSIFFSLNAAKGSYFLDSWTRHFIYKWIETVRL